MLKQRIMTALVLVPLMAAAVFFLPHLYFSFLMAGIVAIGAWEWSGLMALKRTVDRCIYGLLVTLSLVLSKLFVEGWLDEVVLFWWSAALLLVVSYPLSRGLWGNKVGLAFMGLLVLVPAWWAIVSIRELNHGPWWVLFVLCVIWGADTGAYFAGRRFGRHKLAPRVSPGKSIEGVLGGLCCTLALGLGVGLLFELPVSLEVFLLGVLIVTLVSVLGDLLESMVKRHRGVKDSGTLLPGHGGVLDRIDSITAAFPVALALLVKAGAA